MSSPLMGIIPAAGSGIRARPYTYEQHKGMFEIDGKPNILRLIEIMRDDMGITEIVIVLGYMGESIQTYFGDGSALNVRLTYIDNHHLDKGWAWSVLLAKPYLGGRHGCVMLADEFYIDSNHSDLAAFDYGSYSAVCTVKKVDDPALIKKNFSVEKDGLRVIRLVITAIAAVGNIVANLALIPTYSWRAAVGSTLVAELFMAIATMGACAFFAKRERIATETSR